MMAVGLPSMPITLRTPNVVRSTAATERPSSLATKTSKPAEARGGQPRVGRARRKARRFMGYFIVVGCAEHLEAMRKRLAVWSGSAEEMAGTTGLEPATSDVTGEGAMTGRRGVLRPSMSYS